MANTTAVELRIGESDQATIDSACLFNHTGIHFVQGGVYSFAVDKNERWYDAQYSCDANGYPSIGGMRFFEWSRRLPKENWFKLIGCVECGSPVIIGLSLPGWTAPRTGELLCFANDAYLMYWNNRGCIKLSVTRIA